MEDSTIIYFKFKIFRMEIYPLANGFSIRYCCIPISRSGFPQIQPILRSSEKCKYI